MWEDSSVQPTYMSYDFVLSSTGQYIAAGEWSDRTSRISLFSNFLSDGCTNIALPEPYCEYCLSPYLAVSSTGQYMTVVSGFNSLLDGTSYVHDSSDYGITWRSRAMQPVTNYDSISMSSSGQYQLFTSRDPDNEGYLQESTNYGETWASVGVRKTFRWTAVSSSGQYQLAAGSDQTYAVVGSSDYGATWTAKVSFDHLGELAPWQLLISTDGQIQVAASEGYGGSEYLKISCDYGATWQDRGESAYSHYVSMSADGRYMLMTYGVALAKRSSNYGETWTEVPADSSWNTFGGLNAISSTGQYQYLDMDEQIGADWTVSPFSSCDYGVSWQREYFSGFDPYVVKMSSDGLMQLAWYNGILFVKKPPPVRMVVNHIKNKT